MSFELKNGKFHLNIKKAKKKIKSGSYLFIYLFLLKVVLNFISYILT